MGTMKTQLSTNGVASSESGEVRRLKERPQPALVLFYHGWHELSETTFCAIMGSIEPASSNRSPTFDVRLSDSSKLQST